jgi:hypothetical protein
MFEPPPPDQVQQHTAHGLVKAGGPPWRVTRGEETRIFTDWDEADAWFRGDLHLIVDRTIQGI